jgi:hypothetical protein
MPGQLPLIVEVGQGSGQPAARRAAAVEVRGDRAVLKNGNGDVLQVTALDAVRRVTCDLAAAPAIRNDAIDDIARQILQGNLATYQLMIRHIRRTFSTTYVMNLALFGIGIAAFVAALIKGVNADNAAESTRH